MPQARPRPPPGAGRADDPAGHPARPRLRGAGGRGRGVGQTAMSVLVIDDLRVKVGSRQILNGVSLEVRSGEVHALMGPNRSGKSTLSHALMGHPEYEVTGGSVTLDGQDLLGMPIHQRGASGLFLAMQYPTEVPGPGLEAMLRAAITARGEQPNGLVSRLAAEAEAVGMSAAALERAVNVAFSGGEKKRKGTLRLAGPPPQMAGN